MKITHNNGNIRFSHQPVTTEPEQLKYGSEIKNVYRVESQSHHSPQIAQSVQPNKTVLAPPTYSNQYPVTLLSFSFRN